MLLSYKRMYGKQSRAFNYYANRIDYGFIKALGISKLV